MVAVDDVCKAKPPYLTAADAGVEQQNQDSHIAQSIERLTTHDIDHAPNIVGAEAPLCCSFGCFSFHIRNGLSSMKPRFRQFMSARTPRRCVATDCFPLPLD